MSDRRKRLPWIAGAVIALPCLLVAFCLYQASRLPPIDLAALAERSPVVLDRDGKLLRAFVTQDGRWKLPIRAADVDPRYLAMLKAFEDKRFDAHHGIDPVAILRAFGQVLRHGRVISGGSTLTMQVARLIERLAGTTSTQLTGRELEVAEKVADGLSNA